MRPPRRPRRPSRTRFCSASRSLSGVTIGMRGMSAASFDCFGPWSIGRAPAAFISRSLECGSATAAQTPGSAYHSLHFPQGEVHMKVYQRLAQAFKAEGTEAVFGIMGDANMYWYSE